MIDLNKLKKCIDLDNPNKALEYLENNITKHELYMYIVNKIIDQKNNDCVCIPMPTVYNLFMSYIQDKCNEPYKLLEEVIEEKPLIDVKLSNNLKNLRLKNLDDFRKKFIGTEDEHRWIIDFTRYIIYINKGKAKHIYILSPFYSKKEDNIYGMFVYNVNFIDNFKFVDER
jgi:hypothetical protein